MYSIYLVPAKLEVNENLEKNQSQSFHADCKKKHHFKFHHSIFSCPTFKIDKTSIKGEYMHDRVKEQDNGPDPDSNKSKQNGYRAININRVLNTALNPEK